VFRCAFNSFSPLVLGVSCTLTMTLTCAAVLTRDFIVLVDSYSQCLAVSMCYVMLNCEFRMSGT
jgi:hypothetical protein